MDRRLIIAGAATVAGVFAMPAVAQEESARSLPERFAATLSSHDIAAFAALFAEDYINHQMSAASPVPLRASRQNKPRLISLPPGLRAYQIFRSR